MGLIEILLIVLGLLTVVVSFVIPDGSDSKGNQEIVIPEDKLLKLIEGKVNKAKSEIDRKTEETIVAASEKAERSMERLSNEKIMAIDEFSQLVLEKINKNHEEAVFLYDMLNNKHIQLKNTMADINKNVENVKIELKDKNDTLVSENVKKNGDTQETRINYQENASSRKRRKNKQKNTGVYSKYSTNNKNDEKTSAEILEKEFKQGLNFIDKVEDNEIIENKKYEKKAESNDVLLKNSEVDLLNGDVVTNMKDSKDDKETIIKMYKENKTVVEIAKTLGMGVGEVKLIIDLMNTASN